MSKTKPTNLEIPDDIDAFINEDSCVSGLSKVYFWLDSNNPEEVVACVKEKIKQALKAKSPDIERKIKTRTDNLRTKEASLAKGRVELEALENIYNIIKGGD